MHIKNGKDFWAGLMFFGFGLWFMVVSLNYPMGSAVRMGPAYFPTVLSGMCMVLGAMIFLRGFFSTISHPLKVFAFRPLLVVVAAVVGIAAYFADDLLKGAPMVEFALTALALILFFGAFGPRALFVILVAVLIFGYVLEPLGVVIAIIILIVLSALGGHDFRKMEILYLSIGLALFGVFVFVKGLGLPFNLWPGE